MDRFRMVPPKSSSTLDRRSAQRQDVTYRLDVSGPEGIAGCLLDVSQTGMRVRFKSAVDVSAIGRMRIEFPRWLELGAGLDVDGRFVWVRSGTKGATEAGYAFDGLSRKERNVLEVLIQRLHEALVEDRAPED